MDPAPACGRVKRAGVKISCRSKLILQRTLLTLFNTTMTHIHKVFEDETSDEVRLEQLGYGQGESRSSIRYDSVNAEPERTVLTPNSCRAQAVLWASGHDWVQFQYCHKAGVPSVLNDGDCWKLFLTRLQLDRAEWRLHRRHQCRGAPGHGVWLDCH